MHLKQSRVKGSGALASWGGNQPFGQTFPMRVPRARHWCQYFCFRQSCYSYNWQDKALFGCCFPQQMIKACNVIPILLPYVMISNCCEIVSTYYPSSCFYPSVSLWKMYLENHKLNKPQWWKP